MTVTTIKQSSRIDRNCTTLLYNDETNTYRRVVDTQSGAVGLGPWLDPDGFIVCGDLAFNNSPHWLDLRRTVEAHQQMLGK